MLIRWAALVVLTCSMLWSDASPASTRSWGEAPIVSIRIKIAESQQEEFVARLKHFADKNALAIRVAPTRPDGKNISIQMWRADVRVIGATLFDPGEYQIGFFRNGAEPVETIFMRGLMENLKETISGISGISISDQ